MEETSFFLYSFSYFHIKINEVIYVSQYNKRENSRREISFPDTFEMKDRPVFILFLTCVFIDMMSAERVMKVVSFGYD